MDVTGKSSVYAIAEISSNHNRDLDRCCRLIEQAKACGCAAVKFQYFRIDQLFHRSVLEKSEAHRRRAEWELPESFVPPIAERCAALGLDFGCTPFFLDAVPFLAPYVDFFKIASYEMLWHDLHRHCAATGKPVLLSTGMATLDEVGRAVAALGEAGAARPTLLHCNSAYPTPPRDANLAAIETLRRQLGCETGWSDHTGCPGVMHRAVHRYGARVLEMHFDLDGQGAEYGGGHCWLPGPLKTLLDDLRDGLDADGDGVKEPSPSELPDRDWRADPEDGLRPLRRVRATEGQ